MNLPNQEELQALVEKSDGPFVSIFMPTHRVGAEMQQDPIRLKNLLSEAEQRLTIETNLRSSEARKLLRPAQELLEDEDFWQHQSDGLAIFSSASLFRFYRVPLDLEELVVISDRFHLKPLMPILSGDGQFYVLALSQDEVRLLEASRYSVRELEVEEMPDSLAEALRFDEFEKQQQFHTATPPAREGDRAAVFHGHGVADDDEKNTILRYFQQIDKGIQDVLKNQQAPLVLAGVDFLLPIYHEANTYQHLVEDGVEGNPEELAAAELRERAWEIVEPRFQQAQAEAVALYRELINNSERASANLDEIVPAAHYGRIETLFVALGVQQWGSFDASTAEVHTHAQRQPHDEDLLDSAAIHTLVNSGTVYAVESESVPGGKPVAAIFRY